jgi:hypothetical protein
MPFRLLQNHLRDVEQRVSASGHPNLTGEGFNPLFVGQETDRDLRQRWWWFAAFAGLVPTISPAPKRPVASAAFGSTPRSALSARAPILAPRARLVTPGAKPAFTPLPEAAALTPGAWTAFAPRATGSATPFFTPVRRAIFALVILVRFGRGRLLGPSGQKELLEIEFVFW